ncbi:MULTISPECIES: aminopeptidase [Gemella]|uniref:aminopeptidase n=1 Tax=Gemella TaxID=1378 RepID=UPI0007684DFB|nr:MULTISPECIES: aminopeptidase [Gemella]AME08933.1 peptidase M29 [Gemella sp. oral taxon 928]AXI26505.1 aminopeptidase [Gemella sp. ND 6198]
MDLNKRLENYAKLMVKVGLNVQKDQPVLIRASTESRTFVAKIVEACYKQGAKKVEVEWRDQELTKLNLKYQTEETLSNISKSYVDHYQELLDEGTAFLSVIGDDPDGLAGVDSAKMKASMVGRSKALREYMKAIMSDECPWCVVSASTVGWAKRLFPELSDEEAYLKLWDEILSACRAKGEDPVADWEEHIRVLDEKAKFLHENELVKLHITNDLGTDLYVGLPKGHIWQSAGSYAKKAGRFVANIPTEEVFTMPHKEETSGIVYNAKPLNHGGVLIDDFWLKFEKGKVVDYGAKRGYEALKNILETDEGSVKIGEMALVPFDSPISNTGILFLETLFDENAACHIALGKAYPTCVKGGSEMSDEELAEVGANDSLVHVDFMIGESTTNIIGFTADGKEVAIFKDGNWA